MTDKHFLKIFLFILLIAAVLRMTNLGNVPVSLYWDEAAMLADAKVVAQTGNDIHGNPWYQLMYPSYGDYKLPVYIWLASLSVKFFGVSEWALRLPSAIAGLGTVITSGMIAHLLFKGSKKIDPKLIQLMTMIIVGLSPWGLLFSRTAFEGHLAQFFVSLSILTLLSIYSSIGQIRKLKIGINSDTLLLSLKLFLVASIGALATYTYFSVRFVWPIIIIALQLYFSLKLAANNIKVKKLITSTLIGLIIPLTTLFLLLMPMVKSPLYQASNQFRYSTDSILNSYDYALISNQFREKAGNQFIDRFFFHRHVLLIKELIKNYADHLDLSYIFIHGDSNLRHGTNQHGLFLVILLPIFIYGIIKLFLENKRALFVLLIWWMAALLPASVPETTPHALRSLNALVPLSIIIGYGLTQFVHSTMIRSRKLKYRIVLASFIFLAFINLGHFLNDYFMQYPSRSAHDWQDGYKELALTIDENRNSVTNVWIEPFEGRFYLWLLAFGSYSPQEIQALPKENYSMNQIGNINLANYDWKRLKTNPYKVIIAGETNNIQEKIEEQLIKPNWAKEIYSSDGISRFLVVEYGQ